jgi:hypothetical protein
MDGKMNADAPPFVNFKGWGFRFPLFDDQDGPVRTVNIE